ncbi:MAG: putative Ig domain-containing protein [Planctomycetaceae bacterium]
MQEQNRTKLLAGVLAATVGFYGLRPDKMITEPLEERRVALSSALEQKDTASREENDLLDARFELNQWRGQSLPPDALNAQRVYREWLNGLAQECGLGGPAFVVEPKGRRKAQTRDGVVYETIEVRIEAEATLAQLTDFLYRFKKTGLMHRVRDLNVDSEDTEGDPYLTVVMLCEGISMADAPPRDDLFKRTKIAGELEEEATKLTVAEPDKFPSKSGFVVKAGDEYMAVTEVAEDGTWTVERGLENSEPVAHTADTRIEHRPIAKGMEEVTFDDYKQFLAGSPFVKPTPPKVYKPRLNNITNKELFRGEKLDFKVSTADFDPSKGPAAYKLAEGHPEGMAIDGKSGQVTWSPGDDVDFDEYTATVQVTQQKNPAVDLTREFTVALKEKNGAPEITVPREQITAWLGQNVTVKMQVRDETTAEDLTFEIDGVEGAYVDSKTLAFNWRPAEDIDPGEYTAKVTVTDANGKTGEAEIRLDARDDAARYTKFTMSVGRNDEMEATLYDQINNRRTKVKVGSDFSVADITGSVKNIDGKSMVLATKDGEMVVGLGRDIRTVATEFAEQQKAEKKAAPEPAVEAKPEGEKTEVVSEAVEATDGKSEEAKEEFGEKKDNK